MAKTYPINPNVPANGEDRNYGATRIRNLAAAVAEILGIDHYIGTDGGSGYNEDAAGEHSKVTIRNGTAPTAATGKGFLYLISGELYYKDPSNNTIKLTTAGSLNIAALAALANNTYLQAYNQAGDGAVNLIKAGRNEANTTDVVVVPDKIRTASNAAPSEDTQIANKKYIDDQITAAIAGIATIPTIITGTYTGNNASGRQITGLGGRPKILMVFQETSSANNPLYTKTNQDGLYTKAASGDYVNNLITSLDADGFTLGTDYGHINANGYVYVYIAYIF